MNYGKRKFQVIYVVALSSIPNHHDARLFSVIAHRGGKLPCSHFTFPISTALKAARHTFCHHLFMLSEGEPKASAV
jgi:hypothetical protein